jgi:hypothetical protein
VNAAELVNAVTRLGGRVTLEAGKLKARVPADRPDLLETLKANRDAVLEHLSRPRQLMPVKSPWLELADGSQDILDALEAQGTRTLHLTDQDGRKRLNLPTCENLPLEA